jgi:hypothetical protein
MQGRYQAALALVIVLLSVERSCAGELEAACAEAEKKGVAFLAATQHANGVFTTHEWRTLDPTRKRTVDTPFTASQVLYSLTFCAENATARAVSGRAAAYLVAQREGPGVWRYQGRNGWISPDVDDTSMAWIALKRYGQSIPPEALGALRESRNEARLFNTWIGHPSTWKGIDSRNIDAVVNLNALLFFGLNRENFDEVCRYIIAQAESDKFRHGSPYYPSPLAFTHAFSRAYVEGSVSCLEKGVPKIRAAVLELQQKDGGWGDDFETAVGLLTLLNLGEQGEAVERAMKGVVARQMSDGGWALAPAYSGAVGRWRYGSRAVNTALLVEALAKYRQR